MKYFLDTEFIEGFHKPLFGKRRHFIDLISIGIVCEDGREYYAVSNEFDLKAAWKNEWLKDNVLKPIHKQLFYKLSPYAKTYHYDLFEAFSIRSLRNLIKWYGKSNKQIVAEIVTFCKPEKLTHRSTLERTETDYLVSPDIIRETRDNPEFYAYYADYDWVLFCSLFGTMMDLPKGFPMYCRDLKQMMDDHKIYGTAMTSEGSKKVLLTLDEKLMVLKRSSAYPKQTNEHHALADAKWNFELYKFLSSL